MFTWTRLAVRGAPIGYNAVLIIPNFRLFTHKLKFTRQLQLRLRITFLAEAVKHANYICVLKFGKYFQEVLNVKIASIHGLHDDVCRLKKCETRVKYDDAGFMALVAILTDLLNDVPKKAH